MVQAPSAIDCAGDPETCFVTDYEGNTVWKLIWNGSDIVIDAQSVVTYLHPYAIDVQAGDVGGNPVHYIWVSDRFNMNPPSNGTPTPVPTWTPTPTPTPTPPAGQTYTPVPTPIPPILTPYPETHRVTRNWFSELDLNPQHPMSIPVDLSAPEDPNTNKCIVSDRDSFRHWDNKIKISENGVLSQYPTQINPPEKISRPVAVEIVE